MNLTRIQFHFVKVISCSRWMFSFLLSLSRKKKQIYTVHTHTHVLGLLDIQCACIEWTMEQLLLLLCVFVVVIFVHAPSSFGYNVLCRRVLVLYTRDSENNSNNNGKDSKSRIDSVFTSCHRAHCCCCFFVFFFSLLWILSLDDDFYDMVPLCLYKNYRWM